MKTFLSLMFVLAACHDKTTYEPVTIDNWPCATGRLAQAIVVQARHGHASAAVSYSGGAATSPAYMREMMLDEDTELSLKVRVGLCQRMQGGYDCTEPSWVTDDQEVKVDTRKPNPHFAVEFPALACST